LLVNPLLTAGTAALLYAVARDLRYGHRAALVATLAYLFGSLAWPYGKTLLSMTPAGLCLLASFWGVLRARSAAEGAWRWAGGAGLAAGLAGATRYEALVFALPIALWCALSAGKTPPRPAFGRAARRLVVFGAGVALAVVPLVLGMNVLRTGHPLDAGYGAEGTLASLLAKPWYGWFGILLSPGCGLVPHTPLMALGLLGLAWLWEDDPAPALVAGAITLGAIVYYGALSTTWCAFATWGPRYFVAVAPLMALPLAALWTRLPAAGRNPFVLLLGGGLLAWSAGTNLLAVLIDFNRGWQDHWALGVTYLETSWVPFFSGITAHVRLFREWLLDGQGGLDLYLWNAVAGAGPWLTGGLLALGGGLLAGTWLAAPPEARVRARPVATGRAPARNGRPSAGAGLDREVDVAQGGVDHQAEQGNAEPAAHQADDQPHGQEPSAGQAPLEHHVAPDDRQHGGDDAVTNRLTRR
jgi:hypothetical protein